MRACVRLRRSVSLRRLACQAAACSTCALCGARAEVIKTKGMEKIEVEDLVREITPHGRASVPDDVKAELLRKIQLFISTSSGTPAA